MVSRRLRVSVAVIAAAGLLAAALAAAPVAAAPGQPADPGGTSSLRWYLALPPTLSPLSGESQVKISPPSGSTPPTSMIRIESWSWDLTGSGTQNLSSQGAGAGTGKVAPIGTLIITRQFDASSPLLFQLAAAGKGLPQLALEAQAQRQPGAAATTVIKLEMAAVNITDLHWSASNTGGGTPQEVLTLSFDAMRVSYYNTTTPTSTPTTTGSWNRVYNTNQFNITPAG